LEKTNQLKKIKKKKNWHAVIMARGPHLVLNFPLDVLFPLERDEPFDIFLDDGNGMCD
jgi:hypothetical protein